jgi:hypothetical protein
VTAPEGGQLGGHQAGGHRRNADAGRHRPDQAVDASADTGGAERQPGALERAADLGPGDAGRRVDGQRQWLAQVEPGRRRAHPHQPVSLDQLPALLAARALADEEVEPVGLKPLVQQPALVHPQVEVDERVIAAEVAQDHRQPGKRQVVGDADAQPPARPVTAEVGGRLLGRGQDVAGEPGHRLTVGGQRHRVGVPRHQRPPDLLLKAANVLADGRLLDPEPGRRPGEAAGLLNREEGGEELRIIAVHVVS